MHAFSSQHYQQTPHYHCNRPYTE